MRTWLSLYRNQLLLLLLPFVAGTLILFILPALFTVGLAFTTGSAVGAPTWSGLTNFRRLLASEYVRISLQNTLIFVALALPLRVGGALGLALLLQPQRRLYGAARAAVFLPTVIPETAYALIWLWALNPLYGPINLLLGWLGLPQPPWLSDPAWARLGMVLLSAFQLGEGFIIALAGLQSIPRALYEAATVDGASGRQLLRHVTLPLLAPWLVVLTLRDLVISVQNTFAPSFIITYGGPFYSTTFVPLLIYELGFDFMDLGMAAALLLFVVGAALLAVGGVLLAARWQQRRYVAP